MDKTKLIQRLMVTFLEELEEHVRTFNQDLLALEKSPPAEELAQRLASMFRTVHSMKGAARAVNISLIESACHRLEEVLAAVKDRGTLPGREILALLFASADAIEEAGMRLREQQDLSEAPLAALLPRLDAAAGKGGSEAARLEPKVGPAPKPSVPSNSGHEPGTAAGTVRVAASRLDSLLARIGELLVARRRVESRVSDLAELSDLVEDWKREWQRVERTFGTLTEEGEHEAAAPALPRRALAVLGRTRDRLRHLGKELDRLIGAVTGDGRLLAQVTGPLHEEVRRVRMLPFAEACEGLERMVRDLSQTTGKEAELVIEGGDVELDRSILECLKDPLRHLVRNAVDHGAAPAAQRRAAGKPPRTRITIAAALRGSQVEVAVRDDGNGLNLQALREQARRRRLPEPENDEALARLIFLPGLSTSPIITDVSGRGVGLDVVKDRVEALHGSVDVTSSPGAGTCFTLTVPLTLTTLRAVLVEAAGQTFALAGTCVERLVRVRPDDVRWVAGRPMLSLAGIPVPLAPLASVLGLAGAPPDPAQRVQVLIVAVGEKRMALAVDGFIAEQEIVVNSLGPRIRRLHLVSGATLLASGRIALVLNAASVVRAALKTPVVAPAPTTATAVPVRKRLLVADDSVTTRTLEKSILEAAGYEVMAAADGMAAWQLLQEQGADLLVSDVEMPRMDGFALTETVRASRQFHELPVVLVTARESDQDRARGIAVGADAYLLKSDFDQRNLLETIAQLL